MRLIIRVVLLLVFSLSACQQAVVPVTGNQGVIGEASKSEPTFSPTEQVEPSDNQIQSEATVYLPMVSNIRPTPYIPPQGDNRWATVAGNVERTSWTPEEVSGRLGVDWYRPIEAYIPQNVQIIASDGMVFIATARGLYALNATNGAEVWRFDTELPLGNSPTVADGVVYVGGFDRRLYALRVSDGALLWSYNGAGAGYSTNPLVVGGRVILGNRDGAMYAIGAHGSASQGQLLWKYQTGGLIDLTAAYKDGVVYFASNDNYAYALRADNGALVWRSDKLPGDGYQSYWPVIYQDKVIFSAASGYRTGYNPGTGSIKDSQGNDYGKIFDLERDDLYPGSPDGTMFGNPVSGQTWANGKPVLDASRIINYHEAKPWRRVLIMLNRSDGREYTFDSDRDGRAEYMPALFWGTHSGNRSPPIVGQEGVIYFSNPMT
ncbi:MAG: PQQ-binding-like beta-propeller repeat protein, partial [Chloroflexota bacterium]